MRGLLLESLWDIYKRHSTEWPLLVMHWPTRRTYMFRNKEEIEAEARANEEKWRYVGGF